MNHFITLKDISTKDLRRIVNDAKERKNKRKKLSTLEIDKDKPLKGKLLIQMFEKSSLRTRLSFYLAVSAKLSPPFPRCNSLVLRVMVPPPNCFIAR